jgi:hypothetical protein
VFLTAHRILTEEECREEKGKQEKVEWKGALQ